VEHIEHISEALKLLNNPPGGQLVMTLAKSNHALSTVGGPLSSSSSGYIYFATKNNLNFNVNRSYLGHNMHEKLEEEKRYQQQQQQQQQQTVSSPRNLSAAASPIKVNLARSSLMKRPY